MNDIAQQERAQRAQILDFLRRIVGVVFMQVNSKCAHHVRQPLGPDEGARRGR